MTELAGSVAPCFLLNITANSCHAHYLVSVGVSVLAAAAAAAAAAAEGAARHAFILCASSLCCMSCMASGGHCPLV